MQIVLSTVYVLVHLFLLLRYQPYRQHNFFALVVHIALFFTLFLSIFVKLDQGWENKGIYPEDFSISIVTGFLIFCAGSTILVFLVETIARTYGAHHEVQLAMRRSAMVEEISRVLATLPLDDPSPGPDFYRM